MLETIYTKDGVSVQVDTEDAHHYLISTEGGKIRSYYIYANAHRTVRHIHWAFNRDVSEFVLEHWMKEHPRGDT
jgi:hypothetical protein